MNKKNSFHKNERIKSTVRHHSIRRFSVSALSLPKLFLFFSIIFLSAVLAYAVPIYVELQSPADMEMLTSNPFSINYYVNIDSNCTLFADFSGNWTVAGQSTNVSGNWTISGMEVGNGVYTWNVWCVDAANSSNIAWGNTTNWTFLMNASAPAELSVSKQLINEGDIETGDTLMFAINITNIGDDSQNDVWLYDDFNSTFMTFLNQSNCDVYDWASNDSAADDGWIDMNVSGCFGDLLIGDSVLIFLNFTAANAGATANPVEVAIDHENMQADSNLPVNIEAPAGPINLSLISPESGSIFNYNNIDFRFYVNMDGANCTMYSNMSGLWSPGEDLITGGIGNASINSVNFPAGEYIWNVYCFEVDNISNNGWAEDTNWTFAVNSSGPPGANIQVFKNITSEQIRQGDKFGFTVRITNPIESANLTRIWLYDYFTDEINFTGESNCDIYNFSNENGNRYININVTQCIINTGFDENGTLGYNEDFTVLMNFTALIPGNEISNTADVDAYDQEDTHYDQSSQRGMGIGEPDDWTDGLDQWQSSIESPYITRGTSKLINFSLIRRAGRDSCVENLTIVSFSENITFSSEYNHTTAENGTFTLLSSSTALWQADEDRFFCGQDPENFVLNISTGNDAGLGQYKFGIYVYDNEGLSNINKSVFITVPISYSGTVYDIEGAPLEGAVASLYAMSFGRDGDIVLGTFSDYTDENGTFNISGFPGLNVSFDGFGPKPDVNIFYRLSATKYNDTGINHFAMYVGPSLPEISEPELMADWGLADPEIYLKPAVQFRVRVEGYDYQSGPVNQSLCNESGCPDEAFNWTNIGF
ncbi:MAG: carboxypeptidase-like regulatory domain-containing protein, partial [Candidatus Woesearchaeota archaeon]